MVTMMAPPSTALGAAPGGLDGPGHIAYVFYSRLPILNAGNDDEIMGLVIAHEIGHLLLPHGSHSDTGIMRGQWDFRALRRISLHALGFTRSQAQEIRRRASVAAVSAQ
jgi:predicted Zn-dependent protease